jgi:broad specificity phosphatase PhoE
MPKSKKQIYLIRHGETEFNKLGIVQGSGVDSDLNETGKIQSLAFFKKYGHVPFQKIYTSALKRTHQTVDHFLKLGIEQEILPELNEISWGEKEGRIPNSVDNAYYSQLLESWQKGETQLAATGGESPEDVAKRQKKALEIILKNESEDLILIAMHGRAMRILLAQISNLPLSAMDSFPHINTCLYVLDYCYEKRSFEIMLTNDTSHFKHLPEIALEMV